MGKRYELSEEARERIQPVLPVQRRGGKWNGHRAMLNGIFWVLNSGAPWRDMPGRYGHWKTVYGRFRRWTREGLFDRILKRLHLELDEEGRIDWGQFKVDGLNIRTDRSAAGGAKKLEGEPKDHTLGRSRGGFGMKLHLVTDAGGVPLGALVAAGQSHESKSFEMVMDTVNIGGRRRPEAVAGDEGYSFPRIRGWCRRGGIEAVIPARSNQPRERLSRCKYRRRNTVERGIGRLKCCGRIANRHEKLATSFQAMITLAMIQRCPRILDP